MFYPGPAHSRDNVVVWLPESRVLFGTCAVRAAAANALGNVVDADVKEWPASIRRVLERYGAAEVALALGVACAVFGYRFTRFVWR